MIAFSTVFFQNQMKTRLFGKLRLLDQNLGSVPLSGLEAVDDLRDSSGNIYYVSNEGRKELTLELLADEAPEGTEVQ